MKRIAVGILAHVDAGKTTLTEGLLYASDTIDKLGRVDKGNAYLDNHSLERERGITIFSKQAVLEFGSTYMTLIDTPGHIDFSCETERALSVQDYAILVVSATDGVTAHTKTLWHLLSAKSIPTSIFILITHHHLTIITNNHTYHLKYVLKLYLQSEIVTT